MNWIRLVTSIIVSAAVFGFLAWIVPGLATGVGITLGAGVGVAFGLSTGKAHRHSDR
jgi:hypothetical protein